MGASSRHRPSGATQDELRNPLGRRRRDLGCDHAPERVAHQPRRRQRERVEQLVVIEHQVPQVVQRLNAVGRAGVVPGCSGAKTVNDWANRSKNGSQVRP